VKAGGFLIGTPADIIEQLEAVEKRYPGLDGHNLTVKSHDGQCSRRSSGSSPPGISPASREFGFRDEFAQDCLLHQRER